MEERCELCGAAFTCLAGSGEGRCWCDRIELPPEALERARTMSDRCLCPGCLQGLVAPGLEVTLWPA